MGSLPNCAFRVTPVKPGSDYMKGVKLGVLDVKKVQLGQSMGATVWQRDESGGKTFTVGGAPAATTSRTPQQPSQRPGRRKKLVWSRDDAAGTPNTSGHPAPPSTAPAPDAAADGAAQTAKRQRTAAAAAVDGRPAPSAIPAQHINGAANDGSGHAANGTADGGPKADDAAPVKQSVKAPVGAGLARQLRQKEAELERMRQEMYAKQRRLHEEQVCFSLSQQLSRAVQKYGSPWQSAGTRCDPQHDRAGF